MKNAVETINAKYEICDVQRHNLKFIENSVFMCNVFSNRTCYSTLSRRIALLFAIEIFKNSKPFRGTHFLKART